MKTTKDVFLIDINEEDRYKKKLGDIELYFDPEYNPHQTQLQYGRVKVTPRSCKNYSGNELPSEGDLIYFHHFVPDQKVQLERDDEYNWASHDQIFCYVKNDQVVMLGDFIFIEPIKEDEEITDSGIITKASIETIKQHGIVRYAPAGSSEYGVEVGDEIIFTQNSEYELEIEGQTGYVMQMRKDIPIILKDGKETVLGNWSLIYPLDEDDQYILNTSGIYVQSKIDTHKCKGRIVQLPNEEGPYGLRENDEVIFDKKHFYAVEVDDQKHYVVNINHDPFWAKYELN